MPESRVTCCRLTGMRLWQYNDALVLLGKTFRDVPTVVVAAVIHQDDLQVAFCLPRQTADACFQIFGCVEYGDNNTNHDNIIQVAIV